MLDHHRGLDITPAQRHRFASTMSLAADDAGLPDDPEFRAAIVGYVEWGTRLAMHNSRPGADDLTEHAPCRGGAGGRPALAGLRRTAWPGCGPSSRPSCSRALAGCGADVPSVAETGAPVTTADQRRRRPSRRPRRRGASATSRSPAHRRRDLRRAAGRRRGLAIGSEVAQAEAVDTDTPQCAYTYGGDSARWRRSPSPPSDPTTSAGGGSRTPSTTSSASTAPSPPRSRGVEEADVAAGDRAVRLPARPDPVGRRLRRTPADDRHHARPRHDRRRGPRRGGRRRRRLRARRVAA